MTGDPVVVKDSLTLLTDDARALHGISARPMRQIVKLLEAMDAATAGEPIRGALGDYGADFGGTLEVITGEHDGTQVIDGERLVGWVVRTENWWEFVACLPQLHWSQEQEGWVEHAVIYAENTRKREEPRAED